MKWKNKTIMFAICSVLGLIICSTFLVSADGGIVWHTDFDEHVYLPDQKAVIEWDGMNQTTTLSSRFTSNNLTDIAWIVPIFSSATPNVTAGNTEIFDEMAYIFAESEFFGTGNQNSKIIPYLLFGLLFLLLLVLLAGIFHKDIYRSFLYLSLLIILIITLFSVVFFAGSPYSMLNESQANGTVELIESCKVDVYDIAILQATNATDLLHWLQNNEYNITMKASEVLDAYCHQDDVFFVVNKINLTNKYSTPEEIQNATADFRRGIATPLKIRCQPVIPSYPMTMTSINEGTTKINVYVIANNTMQDACRLLDIIDTDFAWFGEYTGETITWMSFEGNTSLLIDDSFFIKARTR